VIGKRILGILILGSPLEATNVVGLDMYGFCRGLI
jgi:hypothetical protein